MKIRLDAEGSEKVDAALKAVNGNAEAWTITSSFHILYVLQEVEEDLAAILPKCAWKGARFTYIPEGPSAKAYKFNAKSTEVEVVRGVRHWFLSDVRPARVFPRSGRRLRRILTPVHEAAAKLYLKKRFHHRFHLDSDQSASQTELEILAEAKKLVG